MVTSIKEAFLILIMLVVGFGNIDTIFAMLSPKLRRSPSIVKATSTLNWTPPYPSSTIVKAPPFGSRSTISKSPAPRIVG